MLPSHMSTNYPARHVEGELEKPEVDDFALRWACPGFPQCIVLLLRPRNCHLHRCGRTGTALGQGVLS